MVVKSRVHRIERGRNGKQAFRDGTRQKTTEKFLVAMRLGETPVLIPNTMVKT